MNIAKLLVAAAGLLFSAASWGVSWPTTTGLGSLTSGSIYCSTTTCNTTGSGLTGSVIKMTAYSTRGASGSTTTPFADNVNPTDNTGNWLPAQITIYSGGGV